jgi:hypothetical protein
LLLCIAACTTEPTDPRQKIANEPIDEHVIEMIATRDGISEDAARASVIETLRWAAAARQSRAADAPELDAPRRDHLRRTALARLWLSDVFEPTHGAQDIPTDDPLIARARADRRNVHPEIVEVCQAIFMPEIADDPAAAELAVADPQWQEKANARALAFAEHVRRTVPLSAPDACTILTQNVQLEPKTGDGVKLKLEGRGGFHLDSCLEKSDDGTCKQPQFAPEWVEVIREGPVPGLRGPFATRFGVHVALVTRVMPATPTDDAALLDHLRGVVHDAWRARELGAALQSLRVDKAVQILGPAGAGEDAP